MKTVIVILVQIIFTPYLFASNVTQDTLEPSKSSLPKNEISEAIARQIFGVRLHEPKDVFEIESALILRKIYNLYADDSLELENVPLFFSLNNELIREEKELIHNLGNISFLNALKKFPIMVRTFSGRIHLMAMFMEVYFRKNIKGSPQINLKGLPRMLRLLIEAEQNSLTEGNLICLETLLYLPITVLRGFAKRDWELYHDHEFAKRMRNHYSNYLSRTFDVSFMIAFYRNILFYNRLEQYEKKYFIKEGGYVYKEIF